MYLIFRPLARYGFYFSVSVPERNAYGMYMESLKNKISRRGPYIKKKVNTIQNLFQEMLGLTLHSENDLLTVS